MTRTALLVAALAIAVPAPHAVASEGPWHLGARFGLNLSTIRGSFSEFAHPAMQPGLAVGGSIEYAFRSAFALELDPQFVQRGYESHIGPGQSPPAIGNLRLRYLEVPLVARVALPALGPATPYVVAGPVAAFALGGSSDLLGIRDDNLGDSMKHVDYGVTAGLGTSFGHGPTRFGLDLRYGTSFEDIWGNKDDVKSINQWTTLAASLSH